MLGEKASKSPRNQKQKRGWGDKQSEITQSSIWNTFHVIRMSPVAEETTGAVLQAKHMYIQQGPVATKRYDEVQFILRIFLKTLDFGHISSIPRRSGCLAFRLGFCEDLVKEGWQAVQLDFRVDVMNPPDKLTKPLISFFIAWFLD